MVFYGKINYKKEFIRSMAYTHQSSLLVDRYNQPSLTTEKPLQL